MLNINKGPKHQAQRCVIYGVGGVGKTTLASKCPDPLFIDLEGGSNLYDISRISNVKTWYDLIHTVEEVATTPGVCKTLVIDTADRAELLCVEEVCNKNGKKSIEDWPYGKGQVFLNDEFKHLLQALDKCVLAGINAVIIAHAIQRKVELPEELGSYDHYELKLSKKNSPMVKEWADALLFANYQTIVTTNADGKNKATGGKRVIYADHNACWDAKNRHGLPEKMDMTYEAIKPIFEMEPVEKPLDKLLRLMAESNVTAEEVQAVVSAKGNASPDTPVTDYSEELITKFCLPYWAKIVQTIEADPNRSPF